MVIYMIAGHAGSGKSTAGDILMTLCGAGAQRRAFGDAVKDDVSQMYSVPRNLLDTQDGKRMMWATPDGEKTLRTLLIEHSAAMKVEYENDGYWADKVVESINPEFPTIIHDWRYGIEYERIKARFQQETIITIRIVRNAVIPLDDPSEHNLDEFYMTYTINNDESVTDLTDVLRAIVEVNST
jgi:hypothetical protein